MKSLSRNHLFSLLLSLTVALVMSSCNRNTIYSHYAHIPVVGWDREDTLFFTVSQLREGGVFTEELGLRTTDQYPYTSLTMIVNQQVFPSGFFQRDTVTVKLVDEEGNRQGGGLNLFQYTVPFAEVQLTDIDSLIVTVTHYMKRENLPGITEVGLTVTTLRDSVRHRYGGK